jgi:hypothetical protein
LAQFHRIAGSSGSEANTSLVPPKRGSMPTGLQSRLVDVLRLHTSAEERCWFCIWDGWAGFAHRASRITEKLELPHRSYVLLEGPLAEIQSIKAFGAPGPSLWWPDDRAWFVATEVDLQSTYVGGSEPCIHAIIGSPDLEALPARPQDNITAHSDRINRPVQSR